MKKKIHRRTTESTAFSSSFDTNSETVSPRSKKESELHPLLKKIFSHRNITDKAQLHNGLEKLLPAAGLKGIDKATERLADCVCEQQTVLIVGDFDADGATSCALAVLALKAMGLENVSYLVPNRFEYGYGLTPEIVEVAALQNPDVIVTVDNGISSVDGVEAANAKGIDVIVTDHHLPGDVTPDAFAVVNPNQFGCDFASKNTAGVGVTFYVMAGLRAKLRERNWFTESGLKQPNMAEYLDLVALGTVADVVPLDHNNRILVHQGLSRIRAGKARPGILALLSVANRRVENVVASDMGFAVGPRLNAAGRLDDMSHGIACLLCDEPGRARQLAEELDQLNADRREIEQGMQAEALQIIKDLDLKDNQALPKSLVLFDPDWHQGVIGIVASRIKDRYHRPVIAFARSDKEGEIKGSARSIEGLHIRDALDAVAITNPGLVTKFGGHAMAAGLTLDQQQLPAFITAFEEQVTALLSDEMLEATILSDGELLKGDLNLFIAKLLRESGPWGQHFPEPVFDGKFHLVQQKIVGQKHLKMVIALDEDKQQLLDAIAFNVDLQQWPNYELDQVRLAYRLDVNEFRDQQRLQLMVEYMETE